MAHKLGKKALRTNNIVLITLGLTPITIFIILFMFWLNYHEEKPVRKPLNEDAYVACIKAFKKSEFYSKKIEKWFCPREKDINKPSLSFQDHVYTEILSPVRTVRIVAVFGIAFLVTITPLIALKLYFECDHKGWRRLLLSLCTIPSIIIGYITILRAGMVLDMKHGLLIMVGVFGSYAVSIILALSGRRLVLWIRDGFRE